MKATLSIAILAVSFAADAQVYKCPGPGGKTIYSDVRCDKGGQQMDPASLRGNNLGPATPRSRAVDAKEPARAMQAEQQPIAAESQCPAAHEIRNLETSASSITIGRKEREFLQAEIRRARACSKEGGNYSADDWRRIKDAQAGQSRMDARDRARERATAESIHWQSASDRETERMRDDKLAEAQREAARRRRTVLLHGCDAAGCFGSDGHYMRSGLNLLGPSGRVCTPEGGGSYSCL